MGAEVEDVDAEREGEELKKSCHDAEWGTSQVPALAIKFREWNRVNRRTRVTSSVRAPSGTFGGAPTHEMLSIDG